MSPVRKYVEAGIVIAAICAVAILMGSVMGPQNLIKTVMETAYDLLMHTVFYLVAITVIVGAVSAVLIEFGVVAVIEKILSPLMKPIFGLPGVASLGAVMTFLSDNPAIVSLAKDKGYRSYFKSHQLYSFVNFGTAFGMGLIVISYMIGQGANRSGGSGFVGEALLGLAGAFVGGVVATRLMQAFAKRAAGEAEVVPQSEKVPFDEDKVIKHKDESVFIRFLNALLDGGKSGLDAGLLIIPGVLVISTAVTLLTNGPQNPFFGYQGKAYEGVPVLPWIGERLKWLFDALFGFTSPEAIAFPITSLGAVGAALGLVPRLLYENKIGGNDIAVFTAMGMCWSGFLSTHTGMMDALGRRDLVGRTILSQTVGGIAAGVAAHYLWMACHSLGWL
jgi:hypothetical protein